MDCFGCISKELYPYHMFSTLTFYCLRCSPEKIGLEMSVCENCSICRKCLSVKSEFDGDYECE